MSETSPVAPLAVRERFLTDPDLGAGNFLDHALRHNPNPDLPLVYTHSTDPRGQVQLRGHSLRDLEALRDQYARWYHANGVRVGDPVAVVVRDGLQPIIHFLALSALGAIAALVNDAMPVATAKRYLDHVGVVGVVADDQRRLAAEYRPGQARPRFLVWSGEVRGHDPESGSLPEGYPFQHGPDDIVALIHSSGTTGTPKSTMVAHRQFWVGKESRMVRFPAEDYDRLLSLMPHTHAGGLSYLLTTVLLGLPTLTMSDWRRAAVEPVMAAFQPTMVASFPRTFVQLATGEAPTAAAAKVHTWFNTGDSAHHGHIRKLVRLGTRPSGLIQPWLLPQGAPDSQGLPGSRFIDGLGSSEMGMALFGQVHTPESERDDRAIGAPVAVVEKAAVLDDAGDELPDGEVGNLAVRTPSRTPGYWNDSELTATFELNGYWLTGDVARRTADGRFYHLDRTVDVIHTGAGPVYTLQLEEVVIAECDGWVLDASVVGVQDATGPVPIAVAQTIVDIEPTEALEQANKALSTAGLATLRALVLLDAGEDFPLGPTGKVLKRHLRTRFAALFTSGVDGARVAVADNSQPLRSRRNR
ncbi:class I adenylate-forming enzyme family protein [Actinokineospora inagensis]|uniref:class I adenylate-forming enzyme family protein n=1 Tax=Actinokineospora inagensis TaxID=103730 RepID=UPI0004166EE3|nr:class I adenylate-forming enzyme family protein [Actinokineospora inagensis]